MKSRHQNSWNVSSCNRLVQERNVQQEQGKHIGALMRVRGAVDHGPPADQPHLRSRLKTRKLQEDRAAEIQLENRILLQKMLNIDTKPSDVSGDELMRHRVPPRSLHGGAQRRELDRITKANQDLLKRLQQAQPSVDPNKWEVEEED